MKEILLLKRQMILKVDARFVNKYNIFQNIIKAKNAGIV
jgi:hypothetical protein